MNVYDEITLLKREVKELRRQDEWKGKIIAMLLDRLGINSEQQDDMRCDDIFDDAARGDLRALKNADPAKLSAYLSRKNSAGRTMQNA